MPKVIDLLRQGRYDELWQKCCGYLRLDIESFMSIQNRLMQKQINLLERSPLGQKIFQGQHPRSVDEFRQIVPLTTYEEYCPELPEKMEERLPAKPSRWVHTSGRSGEYSCKWVPLTSEFVSELGSVICGIGLISGAREWGDTAPIIENPDIIYTVAPRPYISGELAKILLDEMPSRYYPSLEESEEMPFEERIKAGFSKALDNGLDYFFGLSLVLSIVGDQFRESAVKIDLVQLLGRPRAFWRVVGGILKARLARRRILPSDLWQVKGIITSGLDSSVYREKIKTLWGRYPLDIYACTEGSVIATQTWDYGSMTFIPHLNFLEFIPEKEYLKWQLDKRYQPRTVLLNEVQPGENYEIVISNFHGGALVRYRIGDMIRITSLKNENLGIEIPQMVFARRADDLLDFVVIRLTEKKIWEAIENTGIPYRDWVAYKKPGEPILNILLELNEGTDLKEKQVEMAIYEQIIRSEIDDYTTSRAHDDLTNMINFRVKVTLLPAGAFARYISARRSEGADLAHLKPPHLNPPQKVLERLLASTGISYSREEESQIV